MVVSTRNPGRKLENNHCCCYNEMHLYLGMRNKIENMKGLHATLFEDLFRPSRFMDILKGKVQSKWCTKQILTRKHWRSSDKFICICIRSTFGGSYNLICYIRIKAKAIWQGGAVFLCFLRKELETASRELEFSVSGCICDWGEGGGGVSTASKWPNWLGLLDSTASIPNSLI